MRIAILGTGAMASALAGAWAAAGHRVIVAGRSADKARKLAEQHGVQAASPAEAAGAADVVLLAVTWEGIGDMLALAGPALAGKPLVDCTNAVDYATGRLRPATGSAAEHVAALAPGAHVVKALHLFAGTSWPAAGGRPAPTVAMCGDHEGALEAVSQLVRDLGGVPAVLGGLDRARQLEEVAGFVIRLVGVGRDPATAVPSVPV